MALDAIKRILPSCFLAVAIAYFGSDSLDLDYVEERARTILNVAHPRDFIVEITTDDGR